MSWISALRSAQISALVKAGDLQLGLFDERNQAEISSPRFPGERLVVCRNPALAEECQRKREELLQATEEELDKVVEAVSAGRLKTAAAIGERVGRIGGRFSARSQKGASATGATRPRSRPKRLWSGST